MSPRRRLLLDDGDPSASKADQSAAALHDTSENSSANQQLSCTKTEQADWSEAGLISMLRPCDVLTNHRQPYKQAKELTNQQPPCKKALKFAGQSAAAFFTFAT